MIVPKVTKSESWDPRLVKAGSEKCACNISSYLQMYFIAVHILWEKSNVLKRQALLVI